MAAWYRKTGDTRVLAAFCVASVHVAIGVAIWKGRPHQDFASPVVTIASTPVFLIDEMPDERQAVPLPDLPLPPIRFDETYMQGVHFDDPDEEAPSVVGSASAPRLARVQHVDVVEFARRAGVQPAKPRTVILLVNVAETGGASSVDVIQSSGSKPADAAAVEYALSLRWIPATRDHRPISMRIRFPIVLSATSQIRQGLK